MTDFEAAKKKATAEKKDLLVDFTGSDWCGWCIKLNKEVFQHEAFKKGIAEKFVLVELDYPKDSSKLSEETKKQNAKLKETYSIKGFPTILLMDNQGRPFAKTGYQKGGPEKYVTHLDELRAKRSQRDEAFAAANKLTGAAKAKSLVTALDLIPSNYHSHYAGVISEISKLDPSDSTGFVAKQKRKEANQKLQASINTLMRAKDFDTAAEKIDAYISENKLQGEELQQLLGLKMNPLLAGKKFDDAVTTIDQIIAAAPDNAAAKRAAGFKPRIQQMKEQAADQ